MGLQAIIDAAEAVGERDETRQQVFREEFEAYEGGETGQFTRTRAAIAAEHEALETLDEELVAEEGNIGELVDYAEFLTVEQAVHHRDETIEKLESHNEQLREFHDAMVEALAVVSANLDRLEVDGPEAVEEDPQAHFERANDALEAHNEVVEGLDTNLTILNAYLT